MHKIISWTKQEHPNSVYYVKLSDGSNVMLDNLTINSYVIDEETSSRHTLYIHRIIWRFMLAVLMILVDVLNLYTCLILQKYSTEVAYSIITIEKGVIVYAVGMSIGDFLKLMNAEMTGVIFRCVDIEGDIKLYGYEGDDWKEFARDVYDNLSWWDRMNTKNV